MKYLIYISLISVLPMTARAQVSLRLLANHANSDTLSPGDPVILELQLYNADAEYASMHNRAVNQNLNILAQEFSEGKWSQEEYDKEKSRLESSVQPIRPLSVSGTSLLSGLQIYRNGTPLDSSNFIRCNGYPDKTAYVLTESNRLIMQFGIDPDVTADWNPGTHELVIEVDSLRSNSTILVITRSTLDGGPTDHKLLRLAYFNLECGDPAKALSIANQLLERNPRSVDAITLKADAFLVMDDESEALQWYEQALYEYGLQFPDIYEPPEYLLNQIEAIRQRQ